MSSAVAPSADPSDPLSDVAAASGLMCTGVLQRGLSGAFAVALPVATHAVVHAVVRGKAVIAGVEDEPVELGEGQIAVLPHQTAHTIADAWPTTARPTEDGDTDVGTTRSIDVTDVAETVLITLPFFLPSRNEHPIAHVRPMLEILQVPHPELLEMVFLVSKLALLPGPGDHYVACRIAEGVLTKALQQLAGAEEDRFGVFGLFASTGLKTALAAINRDPTRPWSIGELAEIASMPRTQLVEEFHDTVGQGVQDFLVTRRIRFAENLLRTGQASLDQIAERVGFRSNGSFRRAFERVTGHAPNGGRLVGFVPPILRRKVFRPEI